MHVNLSAHLGVLCLPLIELSLCNCPNNRWFNSSDRHADQLRVDVNIFVVKNTASSQLNELQLLVKGLDVSFALKFATLDDKHFVCKLSLSQHLSLRFECLLLKVVDQVMELFNAELPVLDFMTLLVLLMVLLDLVVTIGNLFFFLGALGDTDLGVEVGQLPQGVGHEILEWVFVGIYVPLKILSQHGEVLAQELELPDVDEAHNVV